MRAPVHTEATVWAVSAAATRYSRMAWLPMALIVPRPPPGTSTRYGLGTWSKVFSGRSLTGTSQLIGSTRSPTTVTRKRGSAPRRLRTCSGPIRSSGVRPGYSTNATVLVPMPVIWTSLWDAAAQSAELGGYPAACPLCYNLPACSGMIACTRRGPCGSAGEGIAGRWGDMTFIRRNVWELGGDWADEVLWYARGVAAMKARALAKPTSWRFYAGMHGFSSARWQELGYLFPTDQPPSQAQLSTFWRQCQHGSWYFLPWHRGYVLALEANIRAEVIALNGPDDWALPYWNYFAPNEA